MANILVTGGAGYVGSVCSAELLRHGHKVTIVDDLSTGHLEAVPQGAEFHRVGIENREQVKELLLRAEIEVVFHFAAKALIPESVVNPAAFFETNVSAGLDLLEAMRATGVHKFVLSSTAAVYGDPLTVPIVEDHRTEPVNSYGESKLLFEKILRWYATAYRWGIYAFRYFNASGAIAGHGERHEPETHIIPLLLQTAVGQRDTFEIFGTDYDTPDGTCLRDYVHVVDIAQAHLLALTKIGEPGFRVYNIGTGRSYSVLEVCEAVRQITGRELKVRYSGRRAGDPAVLCASPQRLFDDFGWKPARSDLAQIISSAWKWEREHVATTSA